jgi:hypothetical protein
MGQTLFFLRGVTGTPSTSEQKQKKNENNGKTKRKHKLTDREGGQHILKGRAGPQVLEKLLVQTAVTNVGQNSCFFRTMKSVSHMLAQVLQTKDDEPQPQNESKKSAVCVSVCVCNADLVRKEVTKSGACR